MIIDYTNTPEGEVQELTESLLESRISTEQASRLERLVCEHQGARRTYLRYMLLHCTLPAYITAADSTSGSDGDSGSAAAGLADPPPALSIRPDSLGPDNIQPRPSTKPSRASGSAESGDVAAKSFRRSLRWAILPFVGGAMAASVALMLHHYHSKTSAPAQQIAAVQETWSAKLTASAGARWDDDGEVELGAALEPGQILKLEGGAAEVTFASGAKMIVEGPASFYVESRNSARLEYGKVAATVPPSAHGFVVTSGQVVVKDLGTEFGLSVGREDGVASVDVFNGKVDVTRKDADGKTPEPSHLVQGQAVSCNVQGGDVQSAKHGAQSFIRDLSGKNRVAIALHNTGKVYGTAVPDKYWQIVAESANPKFTPHPAIELHAWTGEYLPNSWANPSRWISTSSEFPTDPAGTYTFRTTADFTNFDPFTVSLKARVLVDDAVDDILVNGRSTGVKLPALPATDKLRFRNFRTIELKGPFAAGKNQIDFVVRNFGGHMMLRVEWNATGVPLIKRPLATPQKSTPTAKSH